MAGLLSSVGRELRHFVRPYFLLPSSASKTAPNSLPKWPYPNSAKRAYDVIGWFMVQINLNYIASAFILLSLKDCTRAMHRMGWYSCILVALAMVFFQFGGRRMLKKGLDGKKKGAGPPAPVPSFKVSPPSPIEPPNDEHDPSDLRWIKHALDNPSHQDGGEGVHPVDLVDGLMKDTVGSRTETPDITK